MQNTIWPRTKGGMHLAKYQNYQINFSELALTSTLKRDDA